jgi:hypothetical protein
MDTGSQLSVRDEYRDEYVAPAGTREELVDPMFAQGGYAVSYPDSRFSKNTKVAFTLGLIAASGFGLYLAAKG